MPMHVVTLRRWQVVSAFVIVCVSFIVVGIRLQSNVDRANSAVHDIQQGRIEARLTLCRQDNKVKDELRSEKADDIRTGRHLLDHPGEAGGLSASLIRRGIAKAQRRRRRLADLNCMYFAIHPAQPPRYLPVKPV